MYFPSKKDLWLGLVVWLALLLSLVFAIRDHEWAALAILIPTIIFVGWIWFGTGYTITETELLVKCGPFRERIPFGRIQSVRRTRSPLSGAALSLNRLEIRHGHGFTGLTLISPADAAAFLEELKKRCPHADFPSL
ncbi:hypothetical membrane protein DUF1200 [Thermacetogenium phaeum DSM 12270]|uniref:Hypothetical membrane protein DUF1200 n=1 Tax=Thermacetogenium phaeum (strain ATCC BAA-254 / DSM 26808 / PB) TaxID=1089553 RepID=K4LHH8_THEPS|nr:PH domain-containing protein [Thermacetogenium phaeum]AFV11405.1 hypothetical membrane protein DUF1200 [Thermacetogenium phaeum DSM 12270]